MTQPSNTPSGLLVIDKPLRLTSMTVCRVVKRRLVAAGAPKRVKVGHGGTLDPLATGVVVVLVGNATKLCDSVMAGEKRYVADVDLSRTSTTDDLEGELVEIAVASPPTREQLDAACAMFVGTIPQRPPAYSAIWVAGERSYHMARAGRAAELPARPVVIHSIAVLGYDWPIARLDIRCGKGTYIRSLARDLGVALGTGGMLAALRRTAVGEFTIERAAPLNDLPERLVQADLLPA
ncbi:MAG: tRNA pseudouridine(55) synthase TruB [Phycisphaerales bacterium]|nr:tRNA pseudouridine(55) synthase TruB [Phycisphaerales bacterium]